ncbi:MAG: hypothetical protein VX938_11750, partial [Myxococcota bacterium]|nr:hypothetical protein [Myxococcota bacterium]
MLYSLTPASRRGEPGKPPDEARRVICEGDPEEPFLMADVAAVCAMALDRTEGAHRLWDAELPSGPAETLSTLISLGSRNPAEGAGLLVRSALSARRDPRVREAIDDAVTQGGTPLPPGVLRALQDQLASVGEPWTTCHAQGLRDRALLAVVRPSESPCPWRAETAGFISAEMSQHSSEALPEGYGVDQDVFGEVLTALEAERDQRSDEVEALGFSALAMDHARSEDPDWLNAFHHRLTEFALDSGDDPQRNRLLSSLTAGVSRSQDGVWAKERIDVLLARAAEIDPDTSIVQSAVADGHAASGRWTAAEEAAFGIARPGVRDQTLSRLADQVLTTELEDRARRSLSMRNGLVDPLDRREALMALGA